MSLQKSTIKILLIFLLASPALFINAAAPQEYEATSSLAEGWRQGNDEFWHLRPVNEKNEFKLGEKVQFFAQANNVDKKHSWSLQIHRGDELKREIKSELDPRGNTWNFSNFNPWVDDLSAGQYRAEYYLDAGAGSEMVSAHNFIIRNELATGTPPYIFKHALTAESFEHGANNEHWNLRPINRKSVFSVGDDVQLLTKVLNVRVDHRYKVELYKDGEMQWDHETEMFNVGEKWNYGNFFPVYYNAHPGNFEFKVYLDIGEGYSELAKVPFQVIGELDDYQGGHTYTSSSWEHGQGKDYWDIKPVGRKNVFQKGEDVHVLAQVKNVYKDHQWRVELYRGEDMLWDYTTPMREVGSGWAFGNFYPVHNDAQPGNYTFKIYINTGDGFEFFDSRDFSVEGENKLTINRSYLSTSWKHSEEGDHWDLKPVNVKNNFVPGETVQLLVQAFDANVDHRYKVELYKEGELDWDYETNWLDVGGGWKFSNFFPVLKNAEPGSYEFWYYLDTGDGFELQGKKSFVVSESPINNGGANNDNATSTDPVDNGGDDNATSTDPTDEDANNDATSTLSYLDYNRGVTVYNTVDRSDFEYFSRNGVATVRLMLMDGDLLLPNAEYDPENPQKQISAENIDKINSIIDMAKEYRIKLIVDVHEAPGMNRWFISEDKPKDTRMWEQNEVGEHYRDLLVEIWDQLSVELSSQPKEAVVYELFNEPEPKTDIDPNENKGYLWTDLQDRLIETIRQNDQEHLIVATAPYSWRIESLNDWTPSDTVLNDPNLIASVHGYRPIQFSIQERAWYGQVEYNSYPGTYDEEHYGETSWDYDMISQVFDETVGSFYREHGIPVYVAEFAVNREAPGADQWLLDMMHTMNEREGAEVWGWSVHVWEEESYARKNQLDYDWSRDGMNDFSSDPEQMEAVLAGMIDEEESLMQ